jgi:hypothetical protein
VSTACSSSHDSSPNEEAAGQAALHEETDSEPPVGTFACSGGTDLRFEVRSKQDEFSERVSYVASPQEGFDGTGSVTMVSSSLNANWRRGSNQLIVWLTKGSESQWHGSARYVTRETDSAGNPKRWSKSVVCTLSD